MCIRDSSSIKASFDSPRLLVRLFFSPPTVISETVVSSIFILWYERMNDLSNCKTKSYYHRHHMVFSYTFTPFSILSIPCYSLYLFVRHLQIVGRPGASIFPVLHSSFLAVFYSVVSSSFYSGCDQFPFILFISCLLYTSRCV